MNQTNIALIGLGVIGAPIAHKLYKHYQDDFHLVLNGDFRKEFESVPHKINEDTFSPSIISSGEDTKPVSLLIICVKNYDLVNSLSEIKEIVSKDTVILPLQNGIFSVNFFRTNFPDNIVLEGYVQGPNTERNGADFNYQNSGSIHIGISNPDQTEKAKEVYQILKDANVDVYYEEHIKHMVWKKFMLNVAGNCVTALTGADYSLFKIYTDLQEVCRQAMNEFLTVANAEGVDLTKKDIDDIIDYYVTYIGSKKTSMLVDVMNENKTENDYLAGEILRVAKKHEITDLPTIKTLYYLMEVKEAVYMEKKGFRTMKNLFAENVEYSDALRIHMNDIDNKMESKDFAHIINEGRMPKELSDLLEYAADNTEFYKAYKGKSIQEFPVMNKTLLNEHYDEIQVHSFDNTKTHKMHTSGSTGIPFTVIQDLGKRERHIADLKYFGALAGYTDHDPMCYLRAKPTATQAQQEKDNIFQLDITNLSKENLTNYFHVMVEKKCVALIAYPSTLETAVDFWSKHFTNESCIRTIISTSETLTDEVKEKLRNFFGREVGIYARYSNTENGILGQETGKSDEYCLNWASYYFEILKLEEDVPAEDGELGRIVITDLYNKAFPMIRYDTGDVAVLQKTDPDHLPGFTQLFGRRMDLIYDTKGEVVSPFLLCRTMRLTHGIEQWQFIQETEKEYTLKITSNKEEKTDLSKELDSFHNTLGEDSIITLEYVQDIPVMNSLKRKLIVSKLKK